MPFPVYDPSSISPEELEKCLRGEAWPACAIVQREAIINGPYEQRIVIGPFPHEPYLIVRPAWFSCAEDLRLFFAVPFDRPAKGFPLSLLVHGSIKHERAWALVALAANEARLAKRVGHETAYVLVKNPDDLSFATLSVSNISEETDASVTSFRTEFEAALSEGKVGSDQLRVRNLADSAKRA